VLRPLSALPPRVPSRSGTLLVFPLMLACCAVGVLLLQAPDLVRGLYLNADTASAPVISALMRTPGPHQLVTLGNYAWYEPLWFMSVTRRLPGSHAIWIAAPFIWFAIALALVAWAAGRSYGRWAALAAVTPMVCVSRGLREIVFTPDWHGALVLHSAVLLTTVVLLYRKWSELSIARRAALGSVVTVITAVGETDRLLLVTAILPFVGTALLLWLLDRSKTRREVAIFALVVGVAGAALGELASRQMRIAGVVTAAYNLNFDLASAGRNATLLLKSTAYLGGGYDAAGHSGPIENILGALVLAAAALAALWICIFALPVARAFASRPDRAGYVLFLGLSVLCTCTVFVFSTAPTDVLSARYVAVPFLDILALLPVIAWRATWRRLLLAAWLSLFATFSVGQLLSGGIGVYGTGPTQQEASALERYVASQGATHGYAEYQDAAVLTWETRMRMPTYPVLACPGGASVCPFFLHTISSWYAPGDSRSFLVVDSAPTAIPVAGRPANLGTPVSSATFGVLTVYIYARDIARQISGLPS
jgi:hypothetical protein